MAKKDEIKYEILEAPKTVEEAAPAEEPYDPWKDMRTIKLPRAPKNEQKFIYVCVNGVAKQVPRGKTVVLPYPLYDVLVKHLEAKEAAEDYRDEIPNEMT